MAQEELGNWGIGELGNWGIGELGNWGIGELGNWGIGELRNWGIEELGNWGIGDDYSVVRYFIKWIFNQHFMSIDLPQRGYSL